MIGISKSKLVLLAVLVFVLAFAGAIAGDQFSAWEVGSGPGTGELRVGGTWPIRFLNSGTKMQFQSGSTLEIQSGTTETHANTVNVTGKLKDGAGSLMVSNIMTDVVIANINAGATLVTVPASRQFRLIDGTGIAYGGACAAVTTVDVLAGATKLIAFAQANLTQSTVLRAGAIGAAVLADGASFTAQPAATNITIGKTGSSVTTCTGVRVILTYALQ